MDLPLIVDALLDFSSNPTDVPPASLSDPNVGDYQKMVDLIQWWIDRMATTPRPLQEKLALFWHGHFATQISKVGHASEMYAQNRLFRASGTGSFEALVQQMSVQVAMLVYLDNDPNSKGSPNENFARELLELFTLGVNQYSQSDVVAAARAWTGHNVDYGATPRVYRFYPERHDTASKTFLGESRNWDGPEIITRILTVEPQRSIAARFIAKKLWSFFAYPNPDATLVAELAAVFVGANLDLRALVRAIFLRPEFFSTAAKQGLVRSPVEWIVTCLRSLGMTAGQTNPQWWMEQMGQMLFEPPNVAGWKNNAYWLNSTAVWARADFARNITWRAHTNGFLAEIVARNASNQHTMTAGAAVDLALGKFGRDPATASTSPWVRGVLVNWLTAQRATEYAPTYSWRDWAQINLTTMTMLSPDVLLA